MRDSVLLQESDSDAVGVPGPSLTVGVRNGVRISLGAALVVSALIVAGCSNQPGSGGGPGPMEPQEPDDQIELIEPQRELTAWEKVAEGIEGDGTVTKEVALQAFALTLGDIPGVTPPSADEVGATCGSAALRWVSRHVDSLTDDELAAIEAVVAVEGAKAGRAERIIQFGDHSCTIGNSAASEDDDGAEVYRPILEQELAKLEQALGVSLGIPVYITLGIGKTSSETLAWASPQTSGNCGLDPATSCRIEILTNKVASASDAELRAILSHELVHCFQATWLPATDSLNQPDWVTEGFATYAGESLNTAADRVTFKIYTQTPLRPLYFRTYDSSGFYFHLHAMGVNVFDRYRRAFIFTSSSEIFSDLIGPIETEFGNTWASVIALDLVRGEAWYMPEAPADANSGAAMGTLSNGKSFLANAGEANTRIAHVDFEADVVRFAATGGRTGRISWDDGGENLLTEIDGQAFCRLPGGCECPPGTTGSPPHTPIPSIGAMIAAAGTTEATQLTVTGASLDDYCRADSQPEPPPAEDVDPCIVGTWESAEWTLPGPLPQLNGRGGSGAIMTIRSSGVATWDFSAMRPMVTFDDQINVTTEQYSRGTASGRVSASNGTWDVSESNTSNMQGFAVDNIIGQYPLVGGPGLFVGLLDGGYTCGGSLLSYTTTDPVEGKTVSVVYSKR